MRGTMFYIPAEIAVTPVNGEVICDKWWVVHPEHGVAFYAQLTGYGRSEEPSPQCNSSEYVAKHLAKLAYADCMVVKLPAVFTGHARKEFNRLRSAALAAA